MVIIITIKQINDKFEIYKYEQLVVTIMSNLNIASEIEDLILLGQNNPNADIKIKD